MKKLLVSFLLLFVIVFPAQAVDIAPPPPDDASQPTVGQQVVDDGSEVDLGNLPVPDELASTGFAMDFDSGKQDLADEWVKSLSDEQRAGIKQLLADNHTEALDVAAAELAKAEAAAGEPAWDAEMADALLAELDAWQSAMMAGLAEILSPEQYALFEASLLPAPELLTPASPESQSDCYYAYYYLYNYGYYYGYYFYVYAYYAYAYTSDPFAELTYDLGYNTYLYAYYGAIYSYYAYAYYYNSTYAYYAYYFTRHAEGFSLYGYYMAYYLYSWTGNAYAYYAYIYGYYSYVYINVGDSYAYSCYASKSSNVPPSGGPYQVYLPFVMAGSQQAAQPVERPEMLDDPVRLPPEGLSIDLSDLPVPEGLGEAGFAMPMDMQRARSGAEWVRSLTPDQQAAIQALLDSTESAGVESTEDWQAALSELEQWQDTMSAGLAEILTPEQYALYQESLLATPAEWLVTSPESQTDCYYSYLYDYYGYTYAYYHYIYAYYAYAAGGDPYLYDNYLFGYNSYLYAYYGYIYSYYAYVYYYNATYAYYAYYFTAHAEIFAYYGYQFAYITYSWLGTTYTYYAYLYGYYGYSYITVADNYAWPCYRQQSILSVPTKQQEQDQWCWAGVTQSVLAYYGTNVAQCTIANYNWNRTDCCSNPSSSACNQPNGMFGSRPSLQACLANWGVGSTAVYDYVGWSSVQAQINAGRPVIARWGWWSCSLNCGHFVTLRGYDASSNVYYVDPWDGSYHTSTYSSFYDDGSHRWTHSLTDV